MHIPDGYLSPSTCAVLYAGAAPFWVVALRRVQARFHARYVPLLSLFSAFSFVVMMFNLPLPGGTTGHAVGMGVAAVVLGPWGAILAISVALAIQAVFFGDGGITAYGANCFNMAIVGSLTAWAVYRAISGRAALGSRWRVVAAAAGGYLGINVSALCAAVEFGIQPGLFHDANGVPLYAPYPLAVAVPAMLIGHLTFAGLAELILSGGIVAYLQRADPDLLRATAPGAANDGVRVPGGWRSVRPLWIGLALLMIATPLGLLAAGSAWGEWGVEDFQSPEVRQQIAAASGQVAPPAVVPSGLERLASVWTAPMPDYAPAFLKSRPFDYVLSAMFGVGLILLTWLGAGWCAGRFRPNRPPPATLVLSTRAGFLERNVAALAETLDHASHADETARRHGLMQGLDPRVKIVGVFALILVAAGTRRLAVVGAFFAVAVALAALSRVSWRASLLRVWIGVLAFTGLIALPAVFLTPGPPLCTLPVPGWNVTAPGTLTAVRLVARAETTATLAAVLVLTTPWAHLLKALRVLRVPQVAVVILGMTHRYIFLLLWLARDYFEARRSRQVGRLDRAQRRQIAAATAGVLLGRSLALSGEVFLAMQSRGFRGEVYLLHNARFRARDAVALAGFATVAVLGCL